MKIGNPADILAAPAAAQAAPAGSSEAAKADPTAAKPVVPDPSAKIELSSTAATLMAGGASAEFDAEKVARISQAIAGGNFRINPEVIADKLISNAQELLTRTQR